MEIQEKPDCQKSLEKGEQSWKNHILSHQTLSQSCSDQNIMVLAKKKTCKSWQTKTFFHSPLKVCPQIHSTILLLGIHPKKIMYDIPKRPKQCRCQQ